MLSCHGATEPTRHNYWAHVPQLESLHEANYKAHTLWNPHATTTEPKYPGTHAPQVERENPHTTAREKPACRNRKSPHAAMKTWRSQKKKKLKKKKHALHTSVSAAYILK